MRNGFLLLALLASVSLFAQPGAIDPTFNCSLYSCKVYTMETLPDNKILVSGKFQLDANSPVQHLIRLNEDGSFDFSFNAEIDSSYRYFCHRQSDGKIIFASYYTVTVPYDTLFFPDSLTGAGYDTSLVLYTTLTDSIAHFHRLNIDGSLDTAYHITAIKSGGSNHYVMSILQPDDKLILFGRYSASTQDSFRFIGDATKWYNYVRLNTDGSIDTTFAFYPALWEEIIYIQPDGKMILRRDSLSTPYAVRIPILYRLNVDGSVDTSYQDVHFEVDYPSNIERMFFQTDGKIFAAGWNMLGGLSDSASLKGDSIAHLVRLNADGSIDSTFRFGYLAYQFPDYETQFQHGTIYSSSFPVIRAIETQPSGKVIVIGDFHTYNGSVHQSVIRLNDDGSIDESFNNYTFSPNTNLDYLTLQSDKILVSGMKYIPNSGESLPIYRLNADTVTCTAFFNMYSDPYSVANWIIENLSYSNAPISFMWYWGDGDSSSGITPFHVYSSSGYYDICLHIWNDSGCDAWFCDSAVYVFKTEQTVTVNVIDRTHITTGISETQNEHAIYISPNPSNGVFTLTSAIPQGGEISVYSITGAKIFTAKAASLNRAVIDISQHPKGIYIVQAANSKGVWTQRVVVE